MDNVDNVPHELLASLVPIPAGIRAAELAHDVVDVHSTSFLSVVAVWPYMVLIMRKVMLMLAATATLGIAGCATDSPPASSPTDSAPIDFRESVPALTATDAAKRCATEIDSVVFLDAVADGAYGGDGFDPHYNANLYTATVRDGEWYFEFLPTHEVMAKATCHTDGDKVVSMTRAEFEQAMRGYTYENYEELT